MKKRSEILLKCFEAIPMGTITDPAKVNACLAVADDLGNLIFPVSAINDLPQMRGVSFRFIFLDHDPHGHDVYVNKQFCKDRDDRALTQEGILKLWKAAGGSDVKVERMDDRSDPNLAEAQVTVGLTGLDGRLETYAASRTVDLRPGSPEANTMKPGQLAQAQMVVDRNAESKARLRAIRKALALKQVYRVPALELPFIIPVLVAQFDESDPAMRRLLGAHALGIVDKVFGRGPSAPALPPADPEPEAPAPMTIEAEVVDDDPPGAVDVPPPENVPPPDKPICLCPCGCSDPLTSAQADSAAATIKTLRCPTCFPSIKTFDLKKHDAIESLEVPGRPDLTVEFMVKKIAAAG